MQDWRFDRFAQLLGKAASRRQLLKAVGAGVAAAIAGVPVAAPALAEGHCSQVACKRAAYGNFVACIFSSRRQRGGLATCISTVARDNSNCARTGCLSGDTCCDGQCRDLSLDPQHCGTCDQACPAEATCGGGECQCAGSATFCSGSCIDTQFDPDNCGSCGNVCPGYQQPNTNVTCALGVCTLSCQGEYYDANGDPADGCEAADAPIGNHTQASALELGAYGCADTPVQTVTGKLISDARVHTNPAIPGFDATTGSAPDWYHLTADGGLCINDLNVVLQVLSSAHPQCYKLSVVTDLGTFTDTTDLSGTAIITQGSGSYSTDSAIYFKVEKTCSTALFESVDYTLNFHL